MRLELQSKHHAKEQDMPTSHFSTSGSCFYYLLAQPSHTTHGTRTKVIKTCLMEEMIGELHTASDDKLLTRCGKLSKGSKKYRRGRT